MKGLQIMSEEELREAQIDHETVRSSVGEGFVLTTIIPSGSDLAFLRENQS